MVGITANDISQYPDDAPRPTSWARMSDQQVPSIGCNIKRKPGNGPAFFR